MRLKAVSGMILTLYLVGMWVTAFSSITTQGAGERDFSTIPLSTCSPSLVYSEPPILEWSRTYGGAGGDDAHCVIQTADGGYALAGRTQSYGAGDNFWLVKTDSSGNVQWNKTYGSGQATSVIQTTDGGYAVAGWGDYDGDGWLVKTDANGTMQWKRTYGGSYLDMTVKVIQKTDGSYALTGLTYSFGSGSPDAWLVKTDAGGIMQWNRTYGGGNYDVAETMVQTTDGGYALIGYTSSKGAGDYDAWLVKTYANGTMQWDRTYGGPTSDWGISVVQTVEGGYAIGGTTWSFSGFWLVKTDTYGKAQWNKTYGGDTEYSMVQTRDGGYTLAGGPSHTDSGHAWLVGTGSSGNMQWNASYGEAECDIARSVVQTSEGGYAIAGWSRSPGEVWGDAWLFKIGPPPPHAVDVAVTNVAPSKTVVGKGFCSNINATVANQGEFDETLDVTAYYGNDTLTFEKWENLWSMGDVNRDGYINDTDGDLIMQASGSTPGAPNWNQDADLNKDLIVNYNDLSIWMSHKGLDLWTYFIAGAPIGTQTGVNLSPGTSTTLTLTWNTTSVPYGNHIISAYARPFQGEIHIADNNYADGTVQVTIAGDINGDRIVNAYDLYALGKAFNSTPASFSWNPNADIDNDLVINANDLTILSKNHGKTAT